MPIHIARDDLKVNQNKINFLTPVVLFYIKKLFFNLRFLRKKAFDQNIYIDFMLPFEKDNFGKNIKNSYSV